MQRDYSSEVSKHLETVPQIISKAEQSFRADLISAIALRKNIGGAEWAPYVDPYLTSDLRSVVPFPSVTTDGYGPSFTFIVHPRGKDSEDSSRVYGIPLLVEDQVSLEESAMRERPVSKIRLQKGINRDTDKLLQLLRELSITPVEYTHQDMIVTMTLADLFDAYRSENTAPFNNVRVQRVTGLIPNNPEKYAIEGFGIAIQRPNGHTESMCFAYGIGDVIIRGRPIVPGGYSPGDRKLTDINTNGEEAFFNIESATATRESQNINRALGNFIVVALPLVGQEPTPVRLSSGSDLMRGGGESMTMSFNPTRSSGSSYGVDLAAFTTGRATGAKSQLVAGEFDHTRPISIMDVRMLTVSPERVNTATSLDHILN